MHRTLFLLFLLPVAGARVCPAASHYTTRSYQARMQASATQRYLQRKRAQHVRRKRTLATLATLITCGACLWWIATRKKKRLRNYYRRLTATSYQALWKQSQVAEKGKIKCLACGHVHGAQESFCTHCKLLNMVTAQCPICRETLLAQLKKAASTTFARCPQGHVACRGCMQRWNHLQPLKKDMCPQCGTGHDMQEVDLNALANPS